MARRAGRMDRKRILDPTIGVAMALAALLEATQPARNYSHPMVMVPAALLVTLPLALRRRFPVGVLLFVAAVGTIEALVVTVPASAIQFVAYLIAIYTVCLLCPTRSQLRLAPVVLTVATVTMVRDPATHTAIEATPTFAIIIAVVLLAQVVRRSREQAAQLRELNAELVLTRARAEELAAAAERLRIAREMHDVLAHSVTVMVLQTGAARMALHDGEPRIRELLLGVENIGREALEELRVILGLVRDVPPDPTVLTDERTELARLIDTMRSAGLPVSVQGADELAPISGPLRRTALRVVQEGLTNALKHTDSAVTTVDIAIDACWLVVRVRDEGRPGARTLVPGGGNGLVGMQERVHAVGGTVECGPVPGGGWEVRAILPLDVESPRGRGEIANALL